MFTQISISESLAPTQKPKLIRVDISKHGSVEVPKIKGPKIKVKVIPPKKK